MSRTARVGLIILLGLIVIAVTCLTAIFIVRQVTIDRVSGVLETVRDTTMETVSLWFEEEIEEVTAWAELADLASQTERLANLESIEMLRSPSSQAAVRAILSPVIAEDHSQGFLILGPDHAVLASSYPEEVGAISSLVFEPGILRKLNSDAPFVSLPIRHTTGGATQVSILSGAPIGKVGMLIFLIDPRSDFSPILQRGRLFSSGETYAINSEGVLISASRFDDELVSAGIIDAGEGSILNIPILDPGVNLIIGEEGAIPAEERSPTRMAASVLRGNTAFDVDGYRDYRGVPVAGAWAWNEEYGFGLATEADWDESFANLTAARNGIIALGILSGIAMIGTVAITYSSEQREQLSQKRYEMTVEGAKEAIISFDEKNRITGWNREAEVMFGWTTHEAMGRPDFIDRVIVPESREFYKRRLEEIRRDKDYFTGARQRREMQVLRVDGTRFPVDVFIVPFSMGKTVGYSAVLRDLSDIKAAQEEVQRSHEELELSYDATLRGWSHALDLRDNETEGHTQRVTQATVALAEVLGVPEKERIHLYRGALLHDIGKIGVPDSVLLKPGTLTEEEWTIMRRHPEHAYQMLLGIPYLAPALLIPRYHHEKWDGTGYPFGMKGGEIPFPARMFSIIDVWDALSSDRPYRKAWDEAKVRAFIYDQSGKHFDPEIVAAFAKLKGWK